MKIHSLTLSPTVIEQKVVNQADFTVNYSEFFLFIVQDSLQNMTVQLAPPDDFLKSRTVAHIYVPFKSIFQGIFLTWSFLSRKVHQTVETVLLSQSVQKILRHKPVICTT